MKLYQQIIDLDKSLTGWGWCPLEKMITMANITLATKPEIAAELGVWAGKSLIPVALAMKQIGRGKIVAIDPWSSEASASGQTTAEDKEWWENQANHELVYQKFTHALQSLGLTSIVEVHRSKSEEIELPQGISLLHLDNNHGEQAYNEAVRLAPKVAQHGIVVLDDLTWTGGHVQRAADWLAANGFVHLHNLGTGACYLKIK